MNFFLLNKVRKLKAQYYINLHKQINDFRYLQDLNTWDCIIIAITWL